jgi:hypothetical protein
MTVILRLTSVLLPTVGAVSTASPICCAELVTSSSEAMCITHSYLV